MSVLGEVEQTFSPPPSTPAGTVLAGAGLARPAAQQQAGTPDSPYLRATLLDGAPPASDAQAPRRFREFVDGAGAPQR